jgi:hypothetical protein
MRSVAGSRLHRKEMDRIVWIFHVFKEYRYILLRIAKGFRGLMAIHRIGP